MFERLFASKQRPYFQHARHWDTLQLDLSGASLAITLPPQDYDFPEEKWGPKFNVFDDVFYNYRTEPDRNGYPPSHRGVSGPGLLKRLWFTYGPIWRLGHIGTLQCTAVICDTARMTPALNCFNPEQFELLVLHGLYYSIGPELGNEYTCLINWAIRRLHGSDWVYLESRSRAAVVEADSNPYNAANFEAWLFTPVFQDKYLMVSFSATGSLPAAASNQAMRARIEAIIPSLVLTLSPTGAQQHADAARANPDSHYSPQRVPEPWFYYTSYRDGNILVGEETRVVERPCTPPPPLF